MNVIFQVCVMSEYRLQWMRRLARLEVYEIASIFMLLALFAVFVACPERIQHVIGFTAIANPLWSNTLTVLLRGVTWFYIAFALAFAGCVYMTRRQTDPVAIGLHRYARVALSFLAVLVVFDIINFYIAVFNPYDHDALLLHLDTQLFGATPSHWFDRVTCLPLTLLFCGAYASWFIMTYLTVFIMGCRSEQALREYVTAALLAFYIGYSTYFFVPAIGPEFTTHYQHSIGPLLKLVDGEGPFLSRDCFPSLHTGLAIVMLVHAWRHARKLFWFYAVDIALIILSTMYLRVHYGVDLVAGAALAVAVCELAPVLTAWWEESRERILAQTAYSERPTHVQDGVSEWA
ncbi:hypothetical protein N007_00695 [Alicyclobacillus acidoterrestris ATCC 49025]|nr:hypothetical protein N007_00695 [Alicyclobacillus acidoterrestris ATCC 49025]